MSAQLAGSNQPSNSFSANLVLAAGVTAYISAPTLADLSKVVGKLQPTEPAANDSAPTPAVAKPDTKKAGTPASQPESTGNAPASTGTPASAPAAASGSGASGGEAAGGPNYNDVKERVLKLAKISREAVLTALGKFTGQSGQPCDHANKLKLEDYAAFIAHADAVIAAGGKA